MPSTTIKDQLSTSSSSSITNSAKTTPTSSNSSFRNINNTNNNVNTSSSFRQVNKQSPNIKAKLTKSNSSSKKQPTNLNPLDKKSTSTSSSSLINEIMNPSSSNRLSITTNSLNLAPSPIIYNVSLAEAEIYDDVESSISTSEPIKTIIKVNDNDDQKVTTNNFENINDYVDYVDNDENSQSSSNNLNDTTNNNNKNINELDEINKIFKNKPLDEEEQEELTNNKQKSTTTMNPKKLKINVICPVINSSCMSSPTASVRSNSTSVTTSSASAHVVCSSKVFIAPEERLSDEAREYWATIDLYNNSKMAFNKRLKSVKLKREKLNAELEQRSQLNSSKTESEHENQKENDELQLKQQAELCTCVKCSIVYHEALIQGITDINAIVCKKCANKLITCKCCSSHHSNYSSSQATENDVSTASSTSNSNSSENNNNPITSIRSENTQTIKSKTTEEIAHFEDKLFNIKNELVNLSETSLDVFQLLLQLSDTMLDLNNQLNTSTNANSFLLLNNNNLLGSTNFIFNQNTNLNNNEVNEKYDSQHLIEEKLDTHTHPTISEENQENMTPLSPLPPIMTTISSSIINQDDLVSKTCISTNSNSNNRSKKDKHQNHSSGFNSISNIINKINNRSHSTSSNNSTKSSSNNNKNNNKININLISAPIPVVVPNTKSIYTSRNASLEPSSQDHNSKLIENLYDKTSVTRFVDSLLNHNNSMTISSSMNNNEEFPSLLSNASTSVFTISNDNSTMTTTANTGIGSNNIYQCLDEEDIMLQHISVDSQSNSTIPYSASQLSDLMSSISSSSHEIIHNKSNATTPSKQPLAISNKIFNQNSNHPKSQQKSSSSSSSSGCGGSASLSSSDLTSLPSTSSSSNNIIIDEQSNLSATILINNQQDHQHVNNRRSFSVKNTGSTSSSTQQKRNLVSPNNVESKFNTLPHNENNNENKSVAGLAATYSNTNCSSMMHHQQQQRSNSVSFRHTTPPSQTTPSPNSTNLNHSASIAHRKPSFKFESSILNRVQNMNVNKIKCLKNGALSNNSRTHLSNNSNHNNNNTENEEQEDNTTELNNKRNSLNNEHIIETAASQIKLLKRHQSINKPVITNETIANMLRPSNLINAKMNIIASHKSNHQISLDSGIYLPSESEDCSFQMNIA